jgi:hypothetical protein
MKKNIGQNTQEVPNIFWRWNCNVKYQTFKIRIHVWCKELPCKTIPCTAVVGSDYKKDVKKLIDIDVFNRSLDSEWAAPTFIQVKKTTDVRILTYFMTLNAQIKRKPFPLSNIIDVLRKLS